MQGEVTKLHDGARPGVVAGDDGRAYDYHAAAVQTGTVLALGQHVRFVLWHGIATEVEPADSARPKSMSSAGSGGGRFDFGRVVERTFSSIGRNWIVFLASSTLLVGIPSLLQVYGQGMVATGLNSASLAVMGIGWVLWLVGTYVLQAVVVKTTVNDMNGRKTALSDALANGLGMFLPLFGLAIVTGFIMFIGLLLLVVPGIIVAVALSVAAPALIMERRGISESLQRSRDLTRGCRWRIFGLFVVYVIAVWLIELLLGGIGLAAFGSGAVGPANIPVTMVTTALSTIVSGVITSAGAAALYYELRGVKEGVGPEQLASVFD